MISNTYAFAKKCPVAEITEDTPFNGPIAQGLRDVITGVVELYESQGDSSKSIPYQMIEGWENLHLSINCDGDAVISDKDEHPA